MLHFRPSFRQGGAPQCGKRCGVSPLTTSYRRHRQTPCVNMNDENTPLWIAPRSAIIVFRFVFYFGEVFSKRHTLISRTLHGLGCPPRAISRSGSPRGEPAASDAATGIGLSIYCLLFSTYRNAFKLYALGLCLTIRDLLLGVVV